MTEHEELHDPLDVLGVIVGVVDRLKSADSLLVSTEALTDILDAISHTGLLLVAARSLMDKDPLASKAVLESATHRLSTSLNEFGRAILRDAGGLDELFEEGSGE